MRRALVTIQFLSIVFAMITPVGCAKDARNPQRPLTIFVAASLGDVAQELAEHFEKLHPEIQVAVSRGASGRLFEQICSGAPCDVFIPADPDFVTRLIADGHAGESTRTALATNQLVVVAYEQIQTANDSDSLTGVLGRIKGPIAIANPEHAPAGRYAKDALIRAGLWDKLQPQLRFADDVRFAARYVTERAVEAGIVYSTDALAMKGDLVVLHPLSEQESAAIEYDGVVIARSMRLEDAARFLKFAASGESRPTWNRLGFLPANPRKKELQP